MKKLLNALTLVALIVPFSLSIGCDTGGDGTYLEGTDQEDIPQEEEVGTVEEVGTTG